jgi:ATP-dependent Zn protease
MKRIDATAYHEAGHVAAYLSLGIGFKYVTIEPGDDALGHCKGVIRGGKRLELDTYLGNARGRDWIEKHVTIFLAGNVAERCFTGRKAVAGSGHDFSAACNLLSNLCGDDDEVSAYFDLMYVRVRNLLTMPLEWMIVQRIASELLNRETVRYKDAKKIAEQAKQDFLRAPAEEASQLWEEAQRRRQLKSGSAKKRGAPAKTARKVSRQSTTKKVMKKAAKKSWKKGSAK